VRLQCATVKFPTSGSICKEPSPPPPLPGSSPASPRKRQGADHRDAVARRDGLAGVPKGTIKYCPTVPKSALDRDRDTVEACRVVLGMRCRPGYKNVYLVERFDEGSTSRSNRPPGQSQRVLLRRDLITPVSNVACEATLAPPASTTEIADGESRAISRRTPNTHEGKPQVDDAGSPLSTPLSWSAPTQSVAAVQTQPRRLPTSVPTAPQSSAVGGPRLWSAQEANAKAQPPRAFSRD
jgi:hypothetical protein